MTVPEPRMGQRPYTEFMTLPATSMGFFGLYGSTAALATTLTLAIRTAAIVRRRDLCVA